METKQTHFKMYKSGRKWVFACALVLTMGGGATVAHADANASSAESNTASGQVVSDGSSSDVTSDSSSDVAGTKDADGTQTQGSNAEDTNQQQDKQNQDKSDEAAQNDTQDQQQSGEEDADSNTQKNESEDQNTAKSGVTADSESLSLTDADKTTNDAKQDATTNQNQQISPASALLNTAARVANPDVPNGGSVYDDFPNADDNNILGISSYFHIFTNEATLKVHTNGNIAAGSLDGGVNFGTNIIEALLDKDISYIQDMKNIASSSFVSGKDTRENRVIFGEGLTVDISNPNRPSLNGTDLDHLLSTEIFQDKDGNVYINFEKEFEKLRNTNREIANKQSVADYTADSFSDQNNRVIDVTNMTPGPDGRIVINLSADVLNGNTPLQIVGLSPDEDGTTILINVDTEGQENYQMNSQIKIKYSDGTDRNNHETEYFGDNHLLWNFFDSTKGDLQHTGTIDFDNTFQGSLLAPSATVNINHNFDGNIVADKVNVVNGETHRWDLQDKPNPDKPEIELPQTLPGINVELPGIENPGTVTPEVPIIPIDPEEPGDIQKPDIENPSVELPGIENPGTVTPEVPVNPEEPNTEEPTTEEPGEETEEPAEELDEEGPDEGSYEHQHADDEIIDEYEEDFEEANTVAEKEALLEKIDAAIAQAQANHDSYLVTQLQAIRAQILKALGYGNGAGLPQTSEAHSGWTQILGLALAGTTLGGWLLRRKREN